MRLMHWMKQERKCRLCGHVKPDDQFGRCARQRSGKKRECRACLSLKDKQWVEKNRGKVLLRLKKYYENNKGKLLEKARQRYVERRDHILAVARTNESRAIGRARKRDEYARRKPEITARKRAWSKANRDKLRAYASQPHMRLHSNVSRSIRSALGQNKNGRKWESLVGYTRGELATHLESLFQPGMTWQNYGLGGWEIDHIKPRDSFTFTTAEDRQFKECWDLNNLQPLWMSDNRRKWAHTEARPA
jgi:hypothetical protein